MSIHPISSDMNTTIDATTGFGDIWIVKNYVEVYTNGDAIDGTGSQGSKTFLIYGNLIADNGDGIHLGDSTNHNGGYNQVLISSLGSIYAEGAAIESAGGGLHVTNEGSLFSIGATIYAEDGSNVIANTGTIRAIR